jgi:hypothetical protein
MIDMQYDDTVIPILFGTVVLFNRLGATVVVADISC